MLWAAFQVSDFFAHFRWFLFSSPPPPKNPQCTNVFLGMLSCCPSVVYPSTPFAHAGVSLYLVEQFQWNLTRIFTMWVGISQLLKIYKRIEYWCIEYLLGHVLIADWSVARFVVSPNDVMNDNMAAFAHVGARLGAFFYWTRFLENKCTVRQYTTLIYLINLLGKLVLGLGLDTELHYFSIFTENKKNEHLIFCECHGR